MVEPVATSQPVLPLALLGIDRGTWSIVIQLNWPALLMGGLAVAMIVWLWRYAILRRLGDFDFDESVFGVGSASFKFKPNVVDRQIAYQIWVELSTRKIGLDIDLKNDVVVELYDSWYAFFGVVRELIKAIPIGKAQSESTQRITDLSINVLNMGLRPHLTEWQARFRVWYDHELADSSNRKLDPQTLQRKFPEFGKLEESLIEVNKRLIAYRSAMKRLAYGLKDAETALVVASMVAAEPIAREQK